MRIRSIQNIEEEVKTAETMEGLRIRHAVGKEQTESRSVVLDVVEFPAGSVHVLHRHLNCEQITYALKGSSLHLSEGDKTRVNEGEAVFVEQGEWHGIENDTNESAVVLIIYGGVSNLEEAGYEELEDAERARIA